MSRNIIHQDFVKGVESILEMGESCPLIFRVGLRLSWKQDGTRLYGWAGILLG